MDHETPEVSLLRGVRWLLLLMTPVVNMVVTAMFMHAYLMLTAPDYLRDGQYLLVFPVAAGIGFWSSLPALALGFWLTRKALGFTIPLGYGLAGYSVLGILGSVVASYMGAGFDGAGWALIGLPFSILGVMAVPMVPFLVRQDEGWIALLLGGLLPLVVLVTFAIYKRRS